MFKHASTLAQEASSLTKLQMFKKVLAMNMASTFVRKRKPVAHIQVKTSSSDRLIIDVYPPVDRQLTTSDIHKQSTFALTIPAKLATVTCLVECVIAHPDER